MNIGKIVDLAVFKQYTVPPLGGELYDKNRLLKQGAPDRVEDNPLFMQLRQCPYLFGV